MGTFAYTIRGREVPFESEREWESLSRVMESTNKYKGENILWSYILFFKWSPLDGNCQPDADIQGGSFY